MTKVTKTEKILRKATGKWEKFLAEGAFKKTLKEFDEDDAYHFDVDKGGEDDRRPQKTAAEHGWKEGDKADIIKGEYKGAIGTVIDVSGSDLVMRLDNGQEVAVSPRYSVQLEETQVNEMTMGERGMQDAQDGNPPSKIGGGLEDYMAAYNAVMKKMGKEPLPIVQPDQAYLDALSRGNLEEAAEADPRVVAMQQAIALLDDLQFDSLESALDNMNTEVLRKLSIMMKELDFKRNKVGNIKDPDFPESGMELYDIDERSEDDERDLEPPVKYGSGAELEFDKKAQKFYDRKRDMYIDDKEEEDNLTKENNPSSFSMRTTYSSDPEMDQVVDIASDMLELGARSRVPVSLVGVESALQKQGFDTKMDKGMLIVDDKYVIADKSSLPASAQKISFTSYAADYLSNLQGEQQDLPM